MQLQIFVICREFLWYFLKICKNRIYCLFGTFHASSWKSCSVVKIPLNKICINIHAKYILFMHFMKFCSVFHEKYQKGNVLGFNKMLKNTTESPDRWRKSSYVAERIMKGKGTHPICLEVQLKYEQNEMSMTQQISKIFV